METGISDHRVLIFSFLKIIFANMPPNKLQHRNCKQFKINSFSKDVENLSATISYTEWEKVFAKPLNRYAPQI